MSRVVLTNARLVACNLYTQSPCAFVLPFSPRTLIPEFAPLQSPGSPTQAISMVRVVSAKDLSGEELARVRCSYPSKVCKNQRAVKLNGTLHKLCDFHRMKANMNQKRLQQRRRLLRQQKALIVYEDALESASCRAFGTYPMSTMLMLSLEQIEPLTTKHELLHSGFSYFDMHVLETMLFDERQTTQADLDRSCIYMERFEAELCL
ncbi:hypothetical protein FI667_g7471, partial [Globisporangium splendens]